MTEPTDTELDAVVCKHWPAFSMQATLVRMWVRAAMRDAIAKWDTPPAEQQAASSAVLKAIREANMQLVRTGDDAFMLVPYKRATAEQQAAPKAAPGEQFDSEGFRAWVLRNLPDETIIGSSAWWADHLTTWAQRFVKAAPQQEAQEPALFVSPKQLAALTDPDDPEGEHGRYLPARKTRKGLFTQPLYAAPQPAPAPLSEQDPLQGAANWLVAAHPALKTSTLAGKLSIGYNRAKRLHDAAIAAQGGKV